MFRPLAHAWTAVLLACLLGLPMAQAQSLAPQAGTDSRARADEPGAAPKAPAPDAPLFNDPPPPDGGWKGLARLLDAISPGVDTSIPLTPSQITDRISQMLDEGRAQEALDIIDRRAEQRAAEGAIGTDVQLLFLRGRALMALNRDAEAVDHYLDMTTLYPELPEPWNNLAVLYVGQGRLAMARDALGMALTANPNYAPARSNLGWVQLMLARQSFQQAAAQGAGGASAAARATESLLQK